MTGLSRRAAVWGLLAAVAVLSRAAGGSAADVGPEPVLLWPDGAPGAMGEEDRDKPDLRVYLPPKEKATGAGVVICPGGGYGALAMDHEGHQVAKWFNSIGVAGFVVKYRLGPRYHHPAPLQDAQRAIRHVRAHAEEFGVSPNRVGVMGFSAGGHLASTVATHFDEGDADSEDPVARQGSRPDFAILAYPVISFLEPFTHSGSRKNLLGDNPDPELVKSLSNETQVTEKTPPTFLFHTGEDKGVPVENSLVFYTALRKANVPAELHVYQQGPHGVGLAPGNAVLTTWKERLADWLKINGFLADTRRAEVRGTITIDGEPLRWGAISFEPWTRLNPGSNPNEAEYRHGSPLPTAWGMVSNGRYSIPAAVGPAVGYNGVEVWDLGSVEPRPTIDDATLLVLTPDGFESLRGANVAEGGENEFNFEFGTHPLPLSGPTRLWR